MLQMQQEGALKLEIQRKQGEQQTLLAKIKAKITGQGKSDE
jgi:hypothetical protein